ncbi:unnamed protein product [Dovyalis caffra]|uniref:Endonuclease/exonuclease/phosphatase domain-containing protein n=1 Tax=Dovyalis caffra TaxID=77055 RepID=A0AAV1SHQ1_9ROSI|nr:unnamed protein product [Dovyalis caffra]
MGYCNPSSSSWLSPRAPQFSPAFPKLQSLFFCFSSKSTNTSISCSTNTGPTDDLLSATTTSHTRHRPYDQTSRDFLRHWIEADHDPPLASSQERFTVVSYNILGDRNASKHRNLYQNVPFNHLKWAYRKRVICQELIGWNPDIICLQEVDKYYDLLQTVEKSGYAGSYKRRTGHSVDGCAMFWKADTFRLLEGETIEFNRYGLRDNVAQLSVFEICRDEPRRILVGNIHVLYNPSRGDVKLGQIRFLLSRAQILAEKWGNIPVVLAGDFNSIPQNYWTDEEVKVATGNIDCHLVAHPFKLNSTYATVNVLDSDKMNILLIIICIFYEKSFGVLMAKAGTVFRVLQKQETSMVLDTLPLDILRRTGGLPCQILGSDHLALVSEFAFTQVTKEGNTTSTATISAFREDNDWT